MYKKILQRWLLSLVSIVCIACSSTVPDTIHVRGVFEHSYGSALAISLFVEGPYGTSLDAARVIVTTPSELSMLLRYNGTKAMYEGTIQNPESGTYVVEISSSLSDDSQKMKIPFTALTTDPDIIDIQDDQKNAYSEGKSPSISSPIVISWNTVPDATVYVVRCYKGSNLMLTMSVDDIVLLVPSGTFTADTYSISVEAQCIYGDPLLGTCAYYSVSSSQGRSVICTFGK